VDVELQEQLLALERDLDYRQGAIIVWEEGLAAFANALRELHTEHDASHSHADDVEWDFTSQACSSSSRSKQHTDLGQALEEF
jgi:hypothetical protein